MLKKKSRDTERRDKRAGIKKRGECDGVKHKIGKKKGIFAVCYDVPASHPCTAPPVVNTT